MKKMRPRDRKREIRRKGENQIIRIRQETKEGMGNTEEKKMRRETELGDEKWNKQWRNSGSMWDCAE